MKVEDVFKMAVALVDEIKTDGSVNTTNTADYKARTPYLANLLQMELIKTGDLTAKYEVSYSPMTNLLGDKFIMKEFSPDDDANEHIYESELANCYCFQADGASGTVYIEDYTTTWNTLETETLANTGLGMVAYKNVLTPTAGATKTRIRFDGSYFYRYVNFGLFKNTFSNVNRMYDYASHVKVDLPTTLHSVKEVFIEQNGIYEPVADTKYELSGTTLSIFIPNSFNGRIRIIYVPNPTRVTKTDLTDTLEIDDYSCNVMAYGLAAAFMNVEHDDVLAKYFSQKFESLKALSEYKKPKSEKRIVNKYGYF